MVAVQKRGRGRPASPELTEQRRDEIIAAAAELFAERGYYATTLDDIAKVIGSTKGLIYHYFPSKPDLYWHVRILGMASSLTRLEAIVASAGSPREKLRRALDDFLTTMLSRYERYLMTLTERGEGGAVLSADQQAKLRDSRRRFVGLYRQILSDGVAEGEFVATDPAITALTLIEAVRGVPHWHRRPGRLSEEAVRDQVGSLLMRSVLRQPDAAR